MNQHQFDTQSRALDTATIWHGESSEKLWRACFVARAALDYSDRDAPLTPIKLARRCNRDVDVVYKWAQAAATWTAMFHYFRFVSVNRDVCRRLRQLRHALPYSHFAMAGDLARRLDLSPLQIFAMLDTAQESGAGVRAMAGNVIGSDGDGEEQNMSRALDIIDMAIELATYAPTDERLVRILSNDEGKVIRVVVLPAEWGAISKVRVSKL